LRAVDARPGLPRLFQCDDLAVGVLNLPGRALLRISVLACERLSSLEYVLTATPVSGINDE